MSSEMLHRHIWNHALRHVRGLWPQLIIVTPSHSVAGVTPANRNSTVFRVAYLELARYTPGSERIGGWNKVFRSERDPDRVRGRVAVLSSLRTKSPNWDVKNDKIFEVGWCIMSSLSPYAFQVDIPAYGIARGNRRIE